MIFFNILFFLHPQIPDFHIVVSQTNIVQTIHQWKYDLFSFQILEFRKIDPYDWFCAPGSHIVLMHYSNAIEYLGTGLFGLHRVKFNNHLPTYNTSG